MMPVTPNATLIPPSSDTAGKSSSLMGKAFVGEVPFIGRRLPLPDGEWTVVAYDRAPAGGDGSESIFLAKIVKDTVAGVTLFSGTGPTVKTDSGYRQSKKCMRTNLLYVQTDFNEEFGRQQCWHVNHNVNMSITWNNKDQTNSLIKSAMGELEIRQVKTPDTFLSAFYRVASKTGYLEAVYFFSPEADGIPEHPVSRWDESDWHMDYINRFPEKVAYVDRLKKWAKDMWPKLKDRFEQTSSPTSGDHTVIRERFRALSWCPAPGPFPGWPGCAARAARPFHAGRSSDTGRPGS